MEVGTRVKIMMGEHNNKYAGSTGRIVKVYPGHGRNDQWPYYFQVMLDKGPRIEAVITRLEEISLEPSDDSGVRGE